MEHLEEGLDSSPVGGGGSDFIAKIVTEVVMRAAIVGSFLFD